jgi:thymidylate synthase
MQNVHRDYHLTLQALLRESCNPPEQNRTDKKSWRLFGERIAHDFREGFPILESKHISMRYVAEELFWFLSGSTNERDLRDRGVDIWKEWAKPDGDLGPIYGRQWRAFPGRGHETVDQIAQAYHRLKDDPNTRRAVVSAWNPPELGRMSLEPCHSFFQLQQMHGRLNLMLHQRSGDWFLGVPYNIASYGLLLELFAYALDLEPGVLILNVGDAHLYENALGVAQEQAEFYKTHIWGSQHESPRLTIGLSKDSVIECLTNAAACRGLRWAKDQFVMHGHKQGPKLTCEVAV